VTGVAALVTGLAAVTAAQQPPPDDMVGPGTAGFIAIFLLALATVVLIRSMVGHLRKVRYGPGPQGDGKRAAPPDTSAHGSGAAPTKAPTKAPTEGPGQAPAQTRAERPAPPPETG
jgi:hypothetical protein